MGSFTKGYEVKLMPYNNAGVKMHERIMYMELATFILDRSFSIENGVHTDVALKEKKRQKL